MKFFYTFKCNLYQYNNNNYKDIDHNIFKRLWFFRYFKWVKNCRLTMFLRCNRNCSNKVESIQDRTWISIEEFKICCVAVKPVRRLRLHWSLFLLEEKLFSLVWAAVWFIYRRHWLVSGFFYILCSAISIHFYKSSIIRLYLVPYNTMLILL